MEFFKLSLVAFHSLGKKKKKKKKDQIFRSNSIVTGRRRSPDYLTVWLV